MRKGTGCEALRAALREEMTRDKRVFLLGEDLGAYGGAFGVTRGLCDDFPGRVVDTPISEGGIVGAAIGAALAGSRPVVEIMFMDFILLALDQLANMAAKLRYVFGPGAACPLVVRTPAGGGRGYGPTHSQCLEALFTHVPGLKVVAPSSPADAYLLLKAAIRDNNPALFVEHKLLYSLRGEWPAARPGRRIEKLGRARIVRQGADVTIAAWSWMTEMARRAAQDLAAAGLEAEVIDLRTLAPLDEKTIVESVRKTGRLVVVEEGTRTGGFAAEIGFRVFEQAFDCLDGPIRRVTCPDVPLSAAPALEQAALPSRAAIAQAAMKLVDGDF